MAFRVSGFRLPSGGALELSGLGEGRRKKGCLVVCCRLCCGGNLGVQSLLLFPLDTSGSHP